VIPIPFAFTNGDRLGKDPFHSRRGRSRARYLSISSFVSLSILSRRTALKTSAVLMSASTAERTGAADRSRPSWPHFSLSSSFSGRRPFFSFREKINDILLPEIHELHANGDMADPPGDRRVPWHEDLRFRDKGQFDWLYFEPHVSLSSQC